MERAFKCVLLFIEFLMVIGNARAQFRPKAIYWTDDGSAFYQIIDGAIVSVDPKTEKQTLIVSQQQLTPEGQSEPLKFNIYSFSPDRKKLLMFTDRVKVWRYNTMGNYWFLDLDGNTLKKLGSSLPAQSLMYAKLSPDGKFVAYVSRHNIYTEDLSTGEIKQLTADGTRKLINGTFDWVYEEEFDCRDGFRWSPDSKSIAYWQVDASKIPDYYMINTTDSVYSEIIPVEYPVAGEPPSPVRIGVVNIDNAQTIWMKVPGDPQQHYIPRMEYSTDASQVVLQQLNRKQNESNLFYCNTRTGETQNFYTEKDSAFIDIKSRWNDSDPTGWDWLEQGKSFLWVSEKDGWRHIYILSKDGNKETLITKGDYDISSIECTDEKNGYVYFMASPQNATQLYLYRIKLDGKSQPQLLSPAGMKGTHFYIISPYAKYAYHTFSNHNTLPGKEWITLPDHKPLNAENSIADRMQVHEESNVEFFKVTTEDNITLDAWMVKPVNFDSTKKYPVVFYVYGEPATSTVSDVYGAQNNFLFDGDLSIEGYFQVSVDNRGTPSLRGAGWRKSIYGKIGELNIRDQAMAAKKILSRPYFDTSRVMVWGWSGGGSSTLSLMFKYPEIYKVGVSISAVTNLLFYDNIYEERYMGLPHENIENYRNGSPVYFAQNLKGKLLFIHGTGDDNVHYNNAEVLLNAFIHYGKQFQFMPYPNRTHSINEGEGTSEHLSDLYSDFLRKNLSPGGR